MGGERAFSIAARLGAMPGCTAYSFLPVSIEKLCNYFATLGIANIHIQVSLLTEIAISRGDLSRETKGETLTSRHTKPKHDSKTYYKTNISPDIGVCFVRTGQTRNATMKNKLVPLYGVRVKPALRQPKQCIRRSLSQKTNTEFIAKEIS